MGYAKIVAGNIYYAPNPIIHKGFLIGNPSQEVYKAEGYKPVTYTDQPEPLGVGWWIETWEETAEAIVQGWDWIEATDEDEISDTEAIQMLTGGDGL